MQAKRTYILDGERFSTLEEFFEEVGRVLIPGVHWGHNLDAFNDILRGGFGTPEEGFIIRWNNADLSRHRLGYDETVRQLQLKLGRCHPANRESISAEFNDAADQKGPTVFDWLVEIIRDHGPEGPESEDGVDLVLA